jgi:hypothetical protein
MEIRSLLPRERSLGTAFPDEEKRLPVHRGSDNQRRQSGKVKEKHDERWNDERGAEARDEPASLASGDRIGR